MIPQLYAVTESYKAVETILEQLRLFLIHAKRKEDLRMIQKIISNPHHHGRNFLSLPQQKNAMGSLLLLPKYRH